MDTDPEYREKKRMKVNKKRFIDAKLVTLLDAIGLSSYQAILVIAAVAQALGHLLKDLFCSHSTIYRTRRKNRKRIAKIIKDRFSVILQ